MYHSPSLSGLRCTRREVALRGGGWIALLILIASLAFGCYRDIRSHNFLVYGTVTTPEGSGIQGILVTVEARPRRCSFTKGPSTTTRTDEAGGYTIRTGVMWGPKEDFSVCLSLTVTLGDSAAYESVEIDGIRAPLTEGLDSVRLDVRLKPREF